MRGEAVRRGSAMAVQVAQPSVTKYIILPARFAARVHGGHHWVVVVARVAQAYPMQMLLHAPRATARLHGHPHNAAFAVGCG